MYISLAHEPFFIHLSVKDLVFHNRFKNNLKCSNSSRWQKDQGKSDADEKLEINI